MRSLTGIQKALHMTTPNANPAPVAATICNPHLPCPHATAINRLVARDEDSSVWRQDLKTDISAIKNAMLEIRDLKADSVHSKMAIERAFLEINSLQKHKNEVEKFISKVDGMTAMAWALWTILGSGVVVSLFKIFLAP
jgi:hypothetical protein